MTPKPLLGPPRPFFVTMTIAPFAAREPYSAAALGPFSTVIDWTLFASMSAAALPTSYPPIEDPEPGP